MRFAYLALAAFAMLPATTFAQSFVNGSFESTNANPGSCNYLHNDGLSTYTNGADTGYGTADNILYIGTPIAVYCQKGLPNHGSAYIGLSSNTTKFDAIALKVSPALEAGKHYVISFVYKASLSGPAITTRLGYSTSNHNDGTLIDTIPSPANIDSVWVAKTYSFSPTTAASWITFKAELSAYIGYSFVEFDNLKIQAAQGIDNVDAETAFSISPNPANGFTTINTKSNEPLTINITDMAGRMHLAEKHLPENGNVKLNISHLPTGLYLLHINNGKDNTVEKLQVTQ